MRIPALALLLMGLGIGCSHPTDSTCPTETPPTWDNFGKGFVEAYCQRCHSSSRQGESRYTAPDDVNFDSVEQVRAHLDDIDSLAAFGPAARNVVMPPTGSRPTAEERTRLGQWLACEAKR